jgi:hypothetical protein
MITETDYRGYTLMGDEVATDIWHNKEYVSTEYTDVDGAKKIIDDWLNAK